ncbi:MAG TPA: NAD(P)H-binding protein [Polyangia bacterium]|jgi:putative NADH-flavin reductase
MAKLVVFGASGDTGRALVELALAAGHTVTAFARNPAAAALPAAARAIAGDVLDADAVAAAIAGQDAVLSALGHRRASRSPFARQLSPPDLFARSAAHMIDAMRRHRVARLVICGVHGAGDSRARTGWLYRWLVERTQIGIALADANVMEAAVAQSGLDWLIARPVSLTNGRGRGKWRARPDRISSFASIARRDVAAFMLAHVAGALPPERTPSLTS